MSVTTAMRYTAGRYPAATFRSCHMALGVRPLDDEPDVAICGTTPKAIALECLVWRAPATFSVGAPASTSVGIDRGVPALFAELATHGKRPSALRPSSREPRPRLHSAGDLPR